MYVEDVDNTTYCQYFLAMLKGIMETWFNGNLDESVTSFL